MTHGIAISSPLRLTVRNASRDSASAPSRLPSLRSTMLRFADSTATTKSLPPRRARSSRSVITSRAPSRSPAIWSATPRTWFALERPSLSGQIGRHVDRLAQQPDRLARVGVQGDAGGSGKRERHDVGIPGLRGEPARIDEPGLGQLVVSREEREIPVVVLGPGAARVRPGLRNRTLEPRLALVDPPGRDPERHERGSQPVRLIDPPVLEIPIQRRAQIGIDLLQASDRSVIAAPHRGSRLLGGDEEPVGGRSVHAPMIRTNSHRFDVFADR